MAGDSVDQYILNAVSWSLENKSVVVAACHIRRVSSTMRSDRETTFTRRAKVVSKKRVVDLTLRLWRMLTSEPWFTKYRTLALSIYK